MTTGIFNILKTVIVIWMILLGVGSFLFVLEGEDTAIYLIQLILAGITIWFLTQVKVKEEPSKPEEPNSEPDQV